LELSGETVPRPVLRRADGWWDVVPVSTAIRAPQVLLRRTDDMSEQRRTGMLFLGIDWGERHHDLCLLDQDGNVLATRRITDGLAGVGALHALVAAHAQDPAQVVGIETDRGLLVGVLLAAGYQVYAVNPQVVSRYRGRHGSSRAKSDRGDAKVLADMVRTDRHNHRQVAGDSSLVEAVKVLARAHQSLIWARQRHVNALRSALRDFYPGALAALGTHLADPEALAVLELAPAPEQGRRLTRAAVRQALIQAGRRRNLPGRVVAVHDALAAPQLAAPEQLEAAYREVVGALVTVLGCLNVQVAALEHQLTLRFAVHAGHPRLGASHYGGGAGGVQSAAGGCRLSVGLRSLDRLTRRAALL
jgi:transposase